ncbi:MAG: amidinotransferase, partial [Chloroflexota bacterium]
MSIDDLLGAAAYGGSGWRPRNQPLRNELGTIWQACGISNEWSPLRSVLLHRPGSEMETDGDPDQIQMLDRIDLALAQQQHDQIAQAYRGAGVQVHYVDPVSIPPPNMMYVADLMLSTPEGVVLGRPASQVRAGEERFVAQRLAQLEIPLLKYIRGYG